MTYKDGTEIHIGDWLRLAGRPGRVVFSIDTDQFSDAFPRDEWAYLGQGVMIEVEGIGLVHLTVPTDPDLELIRRSE